MTQCGWELGGALKARRSSRQFGEACKWLLELDSRLPQGVERKATILYDSEYAYGIATGLNRDKENGALSESVAALVSSVRRKFVLNFRHVYGHTGVHGNEVADRLADRGASGRVSPHAMSWIRLPDGPMGENHRRVEPPRRCRFNRVRG